MTNGTIDPTLYRPAPTPPNGVANYRELTPLAAAAEPQEAKPSLWSLIPKEWRPFVALILLVLGSTSGAAIANVRAIWGLPEKVAAIETSQAMINAKLDQLLAKEPTSKPR